VAFNSKQDVDVDTDRWGVAGRITHQLFKNTSIYGQVRYDEQDSTTDSLGSSSDFENFLATFGVRHVFEPIPLW
jgi:predicted porin